MVITARSFSPFRFPVTQTFPVATGENTQFRQPALISMVKTTRNFSTSQPPNFRQSTTSRRREGNPEQKQPSVTNAVKPMVLAARSFSPFRFPVTQTFPVATGENTQFRQPALISMVKTTRNFSTSQPPNFRQSTTSRRREGNAEQKQLPVTNVATPVVPTAQSLPPSRLPATQTFPIATEENSQF